MSPALTMVHSPAGSAAAAPPLPPPHTSWAVGSGVDTAVAASSRDLRNAG